MNARLTLPLCVCLAVAGIAGCATGNTRAPVVGAYQDLRRGPMLPVERTVTNFDEALRCMDGLLETYGAQASILVENIDDKTQKVPAGTTDMFITAMSQMTRRSRSIRTVAFGDDTKNLSSYMLQSNSLAAFQPELIPTYAVRGSITQFDDNLAKKTADAGATLGIASKNFLGFGASKSTSVNLIGLDLAALRTSDFSVVPGVNARNTAAILQEGKGFDGEAAVSKLGVNFMTSFSKSDGKSVAVRNLVELSAIELMGKLNKIPYWRCLGIDAKQTDVAAEIEDWHNGMGGAEKLAFYVRHLTTLGLIPDDGKPTDPARFKLAYQAYVEALGLEYSGQFSLDVLRAHFEADQAKAGELAATRMQGLAASQLGLVITLVARDGGEQVGFRIDPAQKTHLYCFLRDEAGAIARVYPNRWQRDAAVTPGAPLDLPPPGTFRITPNAQAPQVLRCYTSPDSLATKLPRALAGPDLTPIRGMDSIATLDARFAALGAPLARVAIDFQGRGAGLVANRVEN
jgi:hypothetical protein